tara:strand:- start:10999 stop:11160 length:162 start_codon:yes stop_codon:yes gene_type:complete
VIVKILLTLVVDEEEYPSVPVDGMVEEELQDAIQEYIYDIDGVTIKKIKTMTE